MKHSTKLAFLLAVVFAYFVWRWGLFSAPRMAVQDLRTLLGLLAQVSATMLGFLLAAMAILASISGARLIRNMQKTGHFVVLLNCFFVNTIAFGASMVVAIAATMLNVRIADGAILSAGIFVFSCLLLCDVGWRFWLVLTEIGQ